MAMARKKPVEKRPRKALQSIKIHPEVYEKIKSLKSHPRESFSETVDRLASIALRLLKLREHPRELPEDVLDRILKQAEKKPQQAEKSGSGFIA